MVPRQLAASAKSLIVSQTENATGIYVTETKRRRGIGTGSATVIATTAIAIATTAIANEKGTGTGTKTMTVTGIATVAVTGIVRRRETVVLGTTGTMTTRDGHRVSTDAIVNGTGRMTRRGTVVTETENGMQHEDQVRGKRTGSGVREEMGRKTEKVTMSLERSERQRAMSEARKCVAFSCLSQSLSFFYNACAQRARYDTEASPAKDRKSRAETPEEGEIG
jgi:hypothetical protein